MCKKYLIFIFFYILSNLQYSQNIQWGPEIKYPFSKHGYLDQYLHFGDSVFYTYRSKSGYSALFSELDWYIAQYDQVNLSLKKVDPLFSKDYFKKGKSQPNAVDGFFYKVKGKNYVICSNYEKKTFTAYAIELDDDFHIIDRPIELNTLAVEGGFSKGDFRTTLSEDSSKILIYYLSPFKRFEKEKFVFSVHEINTLDAVVQKELIIPKLDKDFTLIDMKLTSDNKVYLMSKQSYEKSEQKNKTIKDPKYYYSFLIYDLKGNDEAISEYKIELDQKFVNNLAFELVNDQIVVSGFYGLKNSDDISGVFYMRIDRHSGNTIVSDTYDFPQNFINEFYSDKQVKKADKKGKVLEVPKIVFRDFIVKNDGSATLIGEQHFVKEVCYVDGRGNVQCIYYFYYNDIVVTQINFNGEIEWCVKIPKKSVDTQGGIFLGYTMGVTNNHLYFMFNDHVDNLNTTEFEKLKPLTSMKKSAIVLVKLDKFGNSEKQVIEFQAKSKQYFQPLNSFQISNQNQLMLYSIGNMNRGRERFGKFTLPH